MAGGGRENGWWTGGVKIPLGAGGVSLATGGGLLRGDTRLQLGGVSLARRLGRHVYRQAQDDRCFFRWGAARRTVPRARRNDFRSTRATNPERFRTGAGSEGRRRAVRGALTFKPVDSSKPHPTSGAAWRIGLGAGLAGAVLVALKYALRPPTRRRVPDAISPVSFATKVLHTSLGEVVYHDAGRGRPLLFVHNLGLGASSYEWARVYPAFAADWRVIAPDLVGYGESSRPEVAFVAADYVQMLAEFIRALEWAEAPIVIASGLGAGLCVQLAAEHPALVSRLILHMPNGTGDCGPQRLTWLSRLIYRTPLLARFLYRNHLSTRAAVAHWLRKAAFFDPALVTEEMIDVFATCAQQPGAEFSAVRWIGGGLRLDLERWLEVVAQPIALIWGGAVPAGSVELGRRRPQHAGAASLTVFPDAGIMAAQETPQAMIAALQEQLRDDLRVVLKAG